MIQYSVLVVELNLTNIFSTVAQPSCKDTLDNVITQRPLKQQNLCPDKGYDYLEIERESIKRRYLLHIRHREENKELITW